MEVSYKRSAQSKGFDPLQKSRDNVNQLVKRNSEELKSIEKAAESDLKERERQQKAIELNKKIESDQTDRDYKILEGNLIRKEKGRANAAQSSMEAWSKTFGTLESLSKNAAKLKREYDTTMSKKQREADYNEYRTNPEYRKKVQEVSQRMRSEQNVAELEALNSVNVVDQLNEDKYSVARAMSGIQGLTEGQRMGLAYTATQNYPAWQAQQLESGKNVVVGGQEVSTTEVQQDPMLYSQWLSEARGQYMQENGFSSMSIESASPFIDKMDQTDASGLRGVATNFTNIQRSRAGQSANTGIQEIMNRSQSDSQTSGGYAELVMTDAAKVYEQLVYSNKGQQGPAMQQMLEQLFALDISGNIAGRGETDKNLNIILDMPLGRDGTTLRSNRSLMSKFNKQRIQAARSEENFQRQREEQDLLDEADIVLTNPEFIAKATAMAESGDQAGLNAMYSEVMKPLYGEGLAGMAAISKIEKSLGMYTTQSTTSDKATLEQFRVDGTLNREMIMNTVEDPKLRKEYLALAEEQERQQMGPQYQQTEERISAMARRLTTTAINGANPAGIKNEFEEYIARDMKAQVKAIYAAELKKTGGDTTAAGTAASEWLTAQSQASANNDKTIQDGRYKGEVSRYYTDKSATVFKGFPNAGATGPTAIDFKKARVAIQNSSNLLSALETPGTLFSTSQLRDVATRYNNQDGSYYIPPSAAAMVQAAEMRGVKLSINDVINKQINATNKANEGKEGYTPIPNLFESPNDRDFTELRSSTRDIIFDAKTITDNRMRRAQSDPGFGEERANQVLKTSERGYVKFYRTGGETNHGWSEHSDIKQMDTPGTPEDEWGTNFSTDALDDYIHFIDPEFGEITLSALLKKIPIPGGEYGAPRSYGGHAGWDYPTKAGTELFLKNGAKLISNELVPGNGTRTIIELPDGRRFAFLHGEGV